MRLNSLELVSFDYSIGGLIFAVGVPVHELCDNSIHWSGNVCIRMSKIIYLRREHLSCRTIPPACLCVCHRQISLFQEL